MPPPEPSADVGDGTATLTAEAATGEAAVEAAAERLQDAINEDKDISGEASAGANRSNDATNDRRIVRKVSTTPSMASRGSSFTSLSSTTRRARYPAKGRGPLAVPPPYDPPMVDQFGFPCAMKSNMLDEDLWDTRHHLNGNENELKPKGKRDYFSKPAMEGKHLKRELKYTAGLSSAPTSIGLLKSLSTHSCPPIDDVRKPSIVCPDAGPPLVPGRHHFGGIMKDRDGKIRRWNDRWHKSIGALNQNCHPDHRTYFTQKSLFEESKSQQWRCYLHQEIEHGVWQSINCKKPHKFPPLGGRLQGRSGTPIPGATP